MPRLTEDEKRRILKLSEEGFSSREIAKEIFGDKLTRKTTISDFISRSGIVKGVEQSKPSPRILSLDIETAPAAGFYFGNRYEINISQDQVIAESFILTYTVKFLGDDKVVYGALTYEEVQNEDDSRIVAQLYEFLNLADIIIAHNGKQFDIKVINARLLFHGYGPPSPYKLIDTLIIARRAFKFPSNKLDALCHYLGLDVKMDTGGFKLWRGYLTGDPASMQKMVDYNIKDTIILEQAYLKLRPWDTQHPNLNLYLPENAKGVCPCCGSEQYSKMNLPARTAMSTFDAFRCDSCGKTFKSRLRISLPSVEFVNII